jgi:hypothetical protein
MEPCWMCGIVDCTQMCSGGFEADQNNLYELTLQHCIMCNYAVLKRAICSPVWETVTKCCWEQQEKNDVHMRASAVRHHQSRLSHYQCHAEVEFI